MKHAAPVLHFAMALAGIAMVDAAEQDPHAGHDMSTMDQSQVDHSAHQAPPAEPTPGMNMSDHMDDDPFSYMVLFDRLEVRDAQSNAAFVWDADAWFGRDMNRLYLRTEGEIVSGTAEEATVEAFWARPLWRWWNLVLGVREDFQPGESRGWLAAGITGLAPYRVNIQATAYAGDEGRTALRLETEYDLLLTNRLILQPRLGLDAYGKNDLTRGIGSGISSIEIGLRLRYEIRREFAPYAGVAWVSKLGQTGDLAQATGEDPHQLQALAGLRIWF